ncbi:SulP family inorganic anion transporter [Cryobacterium algoricola]|uniref:SulP family inorganic anion transporter n=1 Tax=Cryobacterium algoricola TaxID=1259183 RepID=A0ABY2I8M0_9MICO|nr:SulP family inorganic anion transporter [Cryobacterium algoricola]
MTTAGGGTPDPERRRDRSTGAGAGLVCPRRIGSVAGGLSSSTRLMVITTTSASALAAGSAVAAVPEADRSRALFLLTLIAGILMIAAGVARLGRYTRFVPHSVMVGFLSGIGANIIFGQIPDLFGAQATGQFALAKT